MGEYVLDIGPIMAAINQHLSMGVRQSLVFRRQVGDQEKEVGRFNVMLSLVDRLDTDTQYGGFFNSHVGEPVIADSMVH